MLFVKNEISSINVQKPGSFEFIESSDPMNYPVSFIENKAIY